MKTVDFMCKVLVCPEKKITAAPAGAAVSTHLPLLKT
jgi:hypothetical protein